MGNSEITISFKVDMTMRLVQHFYLNVTINHYWVFVITSDCDPMWILVKWWGRNIYVTEKYVFSNILDKFYVEDTQLQLLWGMKKK